MRDLGDADIGISHQRLGSLDVVVAELGGPRPVRSSLLLLFFAANFQQNFLSCWVPTRSRTMRVAQQYNVIMAIVWLFGLFGLDPRRVPCPPPVLACIGRQGRSRPDGAAKTLACHSSTKYSATREYTDRSAIHERRAKDRHHRASRPSASGDGRPVGRAREHRFRKLQQIRRRCGRRPVADLARSRGHLLRDVPERAVWRLYGGSAVR